MEMCTETDKRALVVVMTSFSRLHLMRQNRAECHNPQPANQTTGEEQNLCDIRAPDSGTEDSKVFWDFTRSWPVNSYRRFEERSSSILQESFNGLLTSKMEARSSAEKLATISQPTEHKSSTFSFLVFVVSGSWRHRECMQTSYDYEMHSGVIQLQFRPQQTFS